MVGRRIVGPAPTAIIGGHDDGTAATAIAVLRRTVAWYAARGITIERVRSDNCSCYRARA